MLKEQFQMQLPVSSTKSARIKIQTEIEQIFLLYYACPIRIPAYATDYLVQHLV